MAGVWTAGGSGTAVGSDNVAGGSADSGAGKTATGVSADTAAAGSADSGAGKTATGVSADTAAAGGSTGGIPAGIREAGSGKNDRQGDSAGLRCRTDLPESGVFCDAGAAVS